MRRVKLLKKIKKQNRVRFDDVKNLLLLYGFEIDRSCGGAHWKIYHPEIIDENDEPLEFALWRPHGRGEKTISPTTKVKYLEYIRMLEDSKN